MAGPVRSVSQAFSLMRLLAVAAAPQSLTDLVRATGTSPSSCLNLLRTLLAEGVIEADQSKRYRLTPSWQGIVEQSVDTDTRMIAHARPAMLRLAKEQDTTVGLWRLGPKERLELIAIGESAAATRILLMIGQRQPIGGGATGRALAARRGVSEADLARLFAALRWQRPLEFPTYAAQVFAAAALGYAVDDGYGHAGICSVAAFLPESDQTYCLSASVFQGSRNEAALGVLGEELCRVAQTIGGEQTA